MKVAAKIETAERYLNGWHGVKKDEKKGFEILTAAAKSGDPAIKRELAECYLDGRGVAKDEKKGVKLLTEAAEQGDAEAKVSLFMCYADGSGVAKDEKKCVELLTKAAEQGDAGAKFNLAECYLRGFGVEKDVKKAIEILWEMIELYGVGVEEVRWELMALYASGCDGERDVEELLETFASFGAEALYDLGNMYLTGWYLTDEIAVPVDPAKRVRFLEAALAGGCVEAREKLAACYREGLGVEKDEAKAAAFERYASRNMALDSLNIKMAVDSAIQYMYDCGEGEKVEAKAAELLREAAELGSEDATRACRMLSRRNRRREGREESVRAVSPSGGKRRRILLGAAGRACDLLRDRVRVRAKRRKSVGNLSYLESDVRRRRGVDAVGRGVSRRTDSRSSKRSPMAPRRSGLGVCSRRS